MTPCRYRAKASFGKALFGRLPWEQTLPSRLISDRGLPLPTSIPFYVGTYTGPKSQGIYLIRARPRDRHARTPELAGEVTNPRSWLHPSKKFLYAAGELDNFNGKKGAWSARSRSTRHDEADAAQPAVGRRGGPCFVSTDNTGKVALVANYGGGSVESLPIGDDGKLGEPATFIQHTGKVADPKRQGGPHAHSIWCTPRQPLRLRRRPRAGQAFVYKLDPATAKLTPNDPPAVETEPRFGPRHFAFHPNGKWVYVISEIACRIDAFTYDADKGTLTEIGSVPTLDREVKPSDSTAEIVVHPSGKFVYGSNRGRGQHRDLHGRPGDRQTHSRRPRRQRREDPRATSRSTRAASS